MTQQTQEDRRILLATDAEREQLWKRLLFSDDTKRENIEQFLCVAVKGAREGNWLCMDKFIHLYTEHESRNLGRLAGIMAECEIECNGEKVNNARERALFQELFDLVRGYMLSAPIRADQIYENETDSVTDKNYYLNNLRSNYAMCKAIFEWLTGTSAESEANA